MKTVTLDKIRWEGDNYFFTPAETLNYYGVAREVKAIAIHWWNYPEKAGTLAQTLAYLRGVEESIHFVVSGDTVVQTVNMANTAFHVGGASNAVTVGIEIDPRTPGNTYETAGALVRFIRGYYGNIPIREHFRYTPTVCSGTIDLKKIDDYAYGRTTAPKPVAPTLVKRTTFSPAKHFKVVAETTLVNIPANTVYTPAKYKVGRDIGNVVELLEYSDGKRFYRTSYARDTAKKYYGFGASKLQEVITPVVEPKPIPPKPTAEEQKLEDLDTRLTAIEAIVKKLVDFISGIFKNY